MKKESKCCCIVVFVCNKSRTLVSRNTCKTYKLTCKLTYDQETLKAKLVCAHFLLMFMIMCEAEVSVT